MSIFTSSENMPEAFRRVPLVVAWVWRSVEPQDIKVEPGVYMSGERRISLHDGSLDDGRAVYVVARESSPYTHDDLRRHLIAEIMMEQIAAKLGDTISVPAELVAK
jgi:hypothetical protein